jgi:sulfotransferase family protein
MSEGRLPDFVIVGAMKSATSTLYQWLRARPDVHMAWPKETNYFAVPKSWELGIEWYRDQFAEAAAGQLAGEASVIYTSPQYGDVAAERMAAAIPNARLIYIVREPIQRLRSHYRHEAQRHRETRSLIECLSEPGNTYLGHSLYHARLEPYARLFPREQILVLRFDDLVRESNPAWFEAQRFLGLPEQPAPGTAHNVTADKTQWTKTLLWMREHGVFTFARAAKLPTPIRKFGKRVFTRGGETFRGVLDESDSAIPPELLRPLWDDVSRLEEWLGVDEPLWPHPAEDRETRSEPA